MNKSDKQNKIKKKKTKRYSIKEFIILFVVLGIIAFSIQIYENGGGIKGIITTFFSKNPITLERLETIYVLAMGVSTDLEKELTDTMMLCAYNPKQQKASILSIPRDTFIGENKIKAKGSDKINSLYSESPQKTLEAVSNLIGIEIPYYAVINTKVLVEVVDMIGGVEFEVPINMSYDDENQNLHIHLKKGLQTLNGEQAEQLLRFRHSNPDKNGVMTTYPSDYGSDDYGRMRTQRDFIIETIRQTLQMKNLTKSKKLIGTVFDNLDTNLTLDTLSPYAPYVVDFNITNIESLQLPGESQKLNNLWFFVHDEEETKIMVEKMKNKLEGIEPKKQEGNIILDGNIIKNN